MSDITVDGRELLSIMKGMRDLLAKSADAELVVAKLDKPPKIPENQANMPIKGGTVKGAGPGTNVVVKSVQEDAPGASVGGEQSEELSSQESSMLNNAAVPEEPKSLVDALEEDDEKSENSEESEDKEKHNYGEPVEKAFPAGHPDGCYCEECKAARAEKEGMGTAEIKSMFKSVRKALDENTALRKELALMKSNMLLNIKKSTDKQVEAQLRKMGVVKTQPAIRKLEIGADQYVDLNVVQKELEDSNLMGQPEQIVNDLSKKSFAEIGAMREATGDLVRFKGWRPAPGMYPGNK